MTETDGPPLPTHVAIIMDGNGRWARGRGMPRSEGHRQGLRVAKSIVLACARMGVAYLSLYVFSTENWKRAADEVGFLMGLITANLRAELAFYRENGIRIVHSGDPAGLPPEVLAEIGYVVDATAAFRGMTLNLAINYGGRDEILRAVARIAAKDPASLSRLGEADLGACLDRPDLPDPDLIIRTAGERRLSNFLIWESAYAELCFSDRLWPDFTEEDLSLAIRDYQGRERRFGGAQ